MKQAKIEIRVRSIDYTRGVYRHLFIIHTDSQGEEVLLRGGAGFGTMMFGNVVVIKTSYNKEKYPIGKYPLDWSPNAARVTIAAGTDAEMQSYVDKMWHKGQQINAAKYDYKLPICNGYKHLCHVQNSNTVVADMLKAAGLELKLPPGINSEHAPGINSYFTHTFTDQALDIGKEALRILGESLDRVGDETFTSKEQEVQDMFSALDRTGVLQKDITNKERALRMAEHEAHRGNLAGEELYKGMAHAQAEIEKFFDTMSGITKQDEKDEL